MDLWKQLIHAPGTYQKKVIPTGECNGRIKLKKEDTDSFSDEDDPTGIEYIKEYQQKELAKYEDAIFNQAKTGTMSMVSGVSSLALHDGACANPEARTETLNRIYNEYVFVKPARGYLPIDTKKQDILSTLEVTNVIIIEGDTGCGKTTQVPQFILDQSKERNEYCNIVVTQPRKLAAISVAKHVSEERGWDVGSIIGYQVGLDKVTSPDTILTYMTAGVLLQKIIQRKDLNEFTHIIIDEVHERTQEMDFLFIILRRFMNTNSMNVKVILMSATFDTDKFAEYFKNTAAGIDIPAWRIDINKPMIHDKSIHYIEELVNLGDIYQDYDFEQPSIPSNIFDVFVQLVLALKAVDTEESVGHVLVFLPGIYEIEVAYNLLMTESNKGKGKFMIVPLHSSIPGHEQGRVFAKPPKGVRKIILSTNIAESSITVPDIIYVIDFCMTKTLVVNPNTQYQTLKLCWASKTNCIQRAGRVGRVTSGRVYRLVSRDFFEHCMKKDIPPEMLRAPLERVVLFSKKLEIAELPQSILALAMDPPDLKNIKATIKHLKEVGALLPTCRGVSMESDGDITMLGTVMWNLPIDVKLSKLICLGYMFSCLEEAIIMAAGCSLTNLFSTPFADRLSAYVNRMLWADGSCSDLYAHLTLYQTYKNNKSTGTWRSIQEEKRWCALNYLSYRSMKDWEVLVVELKERLDNLNIRAPVGPQHVALRDTEKIIILKTIIAGAFYPNYFSRSCDAGQVDEKEVCKVLQGLDQFSTVYFTNMELNQPGPLYEQRIREIISPVSNDVNIYFGTGSSSKIYVSFADKRKPITMTINGRQQVALMPGKVHMDVYKAVRMRQLRYKTTFPIMVKELAWEMAARLKVATIKDGIPALLNPESKKRNDSVIPKLRQNSLMITISHTIDAGHFFVQPTSKLSQDNLAAILMLLNSKEDPLDMVGQGDVEVGGLYASKFSDGLYYRCCVQGIFPFQENQVRINIAFIDYGNTQIVSPNELFLLPCRQAQKIAPQAIECTLNGVQPVVAFNPRGTWPEKANEFFHSKVQDVQLCAKVYSVVNDIVSVQLFRANEQKSINEQMLDLGLAERNEESFLSKENHAQRALAAKDANDFVEMDLLDATPKSAAVLVEAPSSRECRTNIQLRGPFSPLEMNVYAMNNVSGKVMIDGNSINCVLLDYAPQDPSERLLVATNISTSALSNNLTLRHTTLMPGIRGLPALMAMIFSPKILLKASHYGTSYASVLCGLGFDEVKRKSIYPEHDLKVIFDTEFSQEDLTVINEIRYIMNCLIDIMRMHSMRGHGEPHQYHRQLKDRLISLLTKQRESKEREVVQHADSWTKNDFVGNPIAPNASFRNSHDIWPLHAAVELIDKNNENVMLQRHIDDLSSYTRRYKEMPESVTCQFCNIEVVTLVDLREHLCSAIHTANINRFRAETEESRM